MMQVMLEMLHDSIVHWESSVLFFRVHCNDDRKDVEDCRAAVDGQYK